MHLQREMKLLPILAIALVLFCFAQTVSGDWVIEIQLHNYSNPYHAIYHKPDGTYHCCDTECPSSTSLDRLNCTCERKFYCDTQLQVCIGEDQSEECFTTEEVQKSSSSDIDFQFMDMSGNVPLYSTLRLTGDYTTKGTVVVSITAYDYHQSRSFTIDEFNLKLPFQILPYFPTPISYQSTYNVATLILSYRMYCDEDYYGSYCEVLCEPQDDDTEGHYTCGCDGEKVCLDGYTNPNNDCRDQLASKSTTGIGSYDSTTITATSSSYVTLCSTTASTVPGTSDASSNAVQTWQGSTFALGILLAACIGVITGMCVIIIMRNFRKKKRLPNQLTVLSNPTFHQESGEEGRVLNTAINDVSNVLYYGPTTKQADDESLAYDYRPPAPVPLSSSSPPPPSMIRDSYDEVVLDDNKEMYHKIMHES